MIARPPVAVPAWLPAVDRALAVAAGEIRLIRATTAENAIEELARVESLWARGQPAGPALRYELRQVRPELRHALDALAARVEADGPLGAAYGARARELALEAEMIDAVGTPRLRHLALRRFVGESPRDRDDLARGDAWARAWTAAPPAADDAELVPTDDPSHPGSLVSRLAAEIGRLRLPVRVVVQPGLPSLAAVSDDAVLVAAGRRVRPADVARTVMHELAGHVAPNAESRAMPIGLFATGTARGIDDQEGRALALERRLGFLDAHRLRELGLRHLAASATLAGATFVEAVRDLLARGAETSAATRIVARAQRGAAITGGGLAREIVYLPALARVERALAASPLVEPMMRSGRVAADVAPAVARALGLRDESGRAVA